MKIISLSGKKQSGKTTIARLIKDIFLHYDSDLEVEIFSWADPLKQEVAHALGHTTYWVEENKTKLRQLLQAWGTEFRRDLCNKDYWILAMLKRLTSTNADFIIIPDTRFLNELDALKQMGAYIWKVERFLSDDEDPHPSENEWCQWLHWDRVINNNIPFGELKGTIQCYLGMEKFIKL